MYSSQQENEYKRLVDIIFERKYEIRIKVIDNISIEEVSMYGMTTTYDKDYDKALSEELITRWMSINEMVEYFKRGRPFRVANIKDTTEIYEVIHQYLLSWKVRIQNSVNIGNAPVDDLLALDSFATSIHGYACENMTIQKTQSSLVNYFNSIGLGRSAPAVESPKEEQTKRHESLAEIFSEAIMGFRR